MVHYFHKTWADRKTRFHQCWWPMLETKFVGDKFEILVTDFFYNVKVANIMTLSPTSKSCHHHKATNMGVTEKPELDHGPWQTRVTPVHKKLVKIIVWPDIFLDPMVLKIVEKFKPSKMKVQPYSPRQLPALINSVIRIVVFSEE